MLQTVEEIQSVDLIAGKSVAIRFLADDGDECVLQLPDNEAHALSDKH